MQKFKANDLNLILLIKRNRIRNSQKIKEKMNGENGAVAFKYQRGNYRSQAQEMIWIKSEMIAGRCIEFKINIGMKQTRIGKEK